MIAAQTGWTENFIRHDLPLSRGFAYYHAARFLDGDRCRWPGRPSAIARRIDSVKDWILAKLKTTRRP